jgi:hypothetical protein
VPAATAQRILDDGTGQALAVACKGAHMRRATHSALALLTLPELRTLPAARLAQLASFEDIPQRGAEHLLTYWRLGERPVLMGARAA